ncbi:MAG TPA: dehydrogenase, partial [Marmoricola sp.]|nr:dehydrogenase [Marmoricola sp.]
MSRPVILNVSLAGPELDYDKQATLLGTTFRLVRRGTGGSVDDAVKLIEKWRPRVAAIAFSGAREAIAVGTFDGDPDEAKQAIKRACGSVPMTDGHKLTDVLQEWALRSVQADLPGFFSNARVLVLGSDNHKRTVKVLREFTNNVTHADPLKRLDDLALDAAVAVLGLVGEVAKLPMQLIPG